MEKHTARSPGDNNSRHMAKIAGTPEKAINKAKMVTGIRDKGTISQLCAREISLEATNKRIRAAVKKGARHGKTDI